MQPKSRGRQTPRCATLKLLQKGARVDEQQLEPGVHEGAPHTSPMHRSPEQLPDPWLFDSEKLLGELDRCRELVLKIPASTHEAHFAANVAIGAIWNLQEQLRYLLHLHRDGQRAFQKQQTDVHRKAASRAAKIAKASNTVVRFKA